MFVKQLCKINTSQLVMRLVRTPGEGKRFSWDVLTWVVRKSFLCGENKGNGQSLPHSCGLFAGELGTKARGRL